MRPGGTRIARREFLQWSAIAGGSLAIAACGGGSSSSSSTQVTGYFGTFKDLSNKKYGWPSLEHDPVNDSLWTAMQQTAKVDHTNMHFANIDAGGNQATQVQNALNYISQGYNAIYINTGTPSGWDQVIKAAQSAKCYTMNHSPDAFTGATQNVVIDHAQAGYINATAAAKWISANAPGKAAAATLAILNSVPLKLRTDTFKSTLQKLAPDVKIYPDVAVPLNNADASAAAAQNLLTAHPDINILFCYNDDTAEAVATALARQGVNQPTKFWIGGVDGTNAALQSIASGTSTHQASAAFLFGYSAAALQSDLEKLMSGGTVQPTRALLPVLATHDNASAVLAESNGFLDPQHKDLYSQLMHYFSTPLTTGGPLPTIVTQSG